MSQLPLRPNVCILLFNSEFKLLLAERAGSPGIWQFPQGGIEENHSAEATVTKELGEELGLGAGSFRIVTKLQATHEYDFQTPPAYALGRWRGQAQTFWLVEFLGHDSEINLESHEPEFMQWRWCTVEDVQRIAEPKRLPGYSAALKEFDAHVKTRKPLR